MSAGAVIAFVEDEARAAVETTAEGFAVALMERDPKAGASYFAEAGVLVTPDGTAVQGRQRIREVLEQVTASDLELRIGISKVLIAGDLALCQQLWSRSSRGASPDSFSLTTNANLIMAQAKAHWQIRMATPWG